MHVLNNIYMPYLLEYVHVSVYTCSITIVHVYVHRVLEYVHMNSSRTLYTFIYIARVPIDTHIQ